MFNTPNLQKTCQLDVWTQADIDLALSIPGTKIKTVGTPVQGFIFYRTLGDETEIFQIGTIPESRNKGFALQLIHDLQKITPKIFLEVSHTNIAAIKLYTKAGFTEISRRPGYYGPKTHFPGDAMVLVWTKRITSC